MDIVAQFYAGDGSVIKMKADAGMTAGSVHSSSMAGNEDLFAGGYLDAIGAFIDACFGSVDDSVAARIEAAKAATVADLNQLGEVATSAINEAGIEITEMVSEINEATANLPQ